MAVGLNRATRSRRRGLALLAAVLQAGMLLGPSMAQTTSGIPVVASGKTDRLRPGANAQLRRGLDALAAGDVQAAAQVRDELPPSSLDYKILAWLLAQRGGSSAEIATASELLAAWPGTEALQRNAERALLAENPSDHLLIARFAAQPPLTIDGTMALAKAYLNRGDLEAVQRTLGPLWRREKLDATVEAAILRQFGAIIPRADHRIRMERMLYSDRIASALRVANLAGAAELAQAWAAVIRNDRASPRLLEAVPQAQRGAGWMFAKAKSLRRTESLAEAAAVVAGAPRDADTLVDPDAWWIERRVLARVLLDAGDAKRAYEVAAGHAAESPVNKADAEFHAGWIALRFLSDAQRATTHFTRIAEIADGPITRGRAYYWLGRAAEAAGLNEATEHYRRASTYATTFYGQLAAARIGAPVGNMSAPVPTQADERTFTNREAVKAIRRLEAVGHHQLATPLYRALGGQLESPGELALLTEMAERNGDHHLALRIAKAGAGRGIEIGALSHPVGAIPDEADIAGSGKALAYAIARQESEFNVGAVSKAGARGLLQLMPGTAQQVARTTGLAYAPERLTSDPGYNATLGAAYLGEQLARFNGSYILTFAGYNAGPRRAMEWVKRYGDPRGKDIDTVVDWIERIPFSETRSYVQRVMENYQVYKAQLTGEADIVRDLVAGR